MGKKNPALYWMCSPLVLFYFLNNTEAYNICTGLGSNSDLAMPKITGVCMSVLCRYHTTPQKCLEHPAMLACVGSAILNVLCLGGLL